MTSDERDKLVSLANRIELFCGGYGINVSNLDAKLLRELVKRHDELMSLEAGDD